MKCIKFRKGNDVKWQSQVGGRWTHKRGEIIAVIGAGVLPKIEGLRVRGSAREYESYVVRTKKGEVYWPYPSALRKV